MRLFSEQGFDQTTVEQIAAAAGISGRTFFRYFTGKAEVLWYSFDHEVAALRAAFATVPDDEPLMAAVRRVVVNANRYRAEDVPELRTRMRLITTVPALAATAGPHYDAWERAVSDFAASRLSELKITFLEENLFYDSHTPIDFEVNPPLLLRILLLIDF